VNVNIWFYVFLCVQATCTQSVRPVASKKVSNIPGDFLVSALHVSCPKKSGPIWDRAEASVLKGTNHMLIVAVANLLIVVTDLSYKIFIYWRFR
jgi:hypothetical protein